MGVTEVDSTTNGLRIKSKFAGFDLMQIKRCSFEPGKEFNEIVIERNDGSVFGFYKIKTELTNTYFTANSISDYDSKSGSFSMQASQRFYEYPSKGANISNESMAFGILLIAINISDEAWPLVLTPDEDYYYRCCGSSPIEARQNCYELAAALCSRGGGNIGANCTDIAADGCGTYEGCIEYDCNR